MEQYLANSRCRQARRVSKLHRIYIDTNYWIHLREAYFGKSNSDRYRDLLEILEALVARRVVAIPISDQLVDEICHQNDPRSRRATAEVVDLLSEGLALLGFPQRKFEEFHQWILALSGDESSIPLDRVWTTVPNVYGIARFESDHPDQAFTAAFFKTVDDLSHLSGLQDIIDNLNWNETAQSSWRTLAGELTNYKQTIWQKQGTFRDVFRDEAMGYFDNVLSEAPPVIVEELKCLPDGRNLQGPELINNAKKIFLDCEQNGLLPRSLPALRIIASGHGKIRTESHRRFKGGDGADLFHAAAAIPYCQIFLTDSSNKHLLTTLPMNVAALYNCTIISSPEDAAEHLKSLIA